jgi:hypothetical protein
MHRLEKAGLLKTRTHGRRVLVDPIAFKRARQLYADLHKTQAAETVKRRRKASAVPASHVEAQTAKVQLDVELRALDLARKRGDLVAIAGPHGIEAALATAAGSILRALDLLPTRAQEILTAAQGDNPMVAVRALLKKFIRDTRQIIATEMAQVTAQGEAAEEADEMSVEVDFENQPTNSESQQCE